MIPGRDFPRDKEELLREFDARQRLKAVQRRQLLRQRLLPKWWEAGMVMLLFIAALGLLASLYQYSDLREEPLSAWLLFWFALMVLSTVLSFEVLLVKIFNLRRSNEALLQMVDDLRKRHDALEQRFDREEIGSEASVAEKSG